GYARGLGELVHAQAVETFLDDHGQGLFAEGLVLFGVAGAHRLIIYDGSLTIIPGPTGRSRTCGSQPAGGGGWGGRGGGKAECGGRSLGRAPGPQIKAL